MPDRPAARGHGAAEGASAQPLSYAIVTPARDEAENVRRLARSLAAQAATPATWLLVDDGSEDGTRQLVQSLAQEHAWIRLATTDGGALARGAPIVRAFHHGLTALDPLPDVVVKLDADMSMPPDHFQRLLAEFERDPRLGIAGGIGYEKGADGVWRQRHSTGPPVWGGCRAYRRECLREILPLEERMGWDTLDLIKANLKGWATKVFYDLAFRHHRAEGERDGRRFHVSMIQGEAAHYMDYRPSYLVVRTAFRMRHEPAAIGLLIGFARAWASRRPRCADDELRRYVRDQQRLRKLPVRAREARRPRAELIEH